MPKTLVRFEHPPLYGLEECLEFGLKEAFLTGCNDLRCDFRVNLSAKPSHGIRAMFVRAIQSAHAEIALNNHARMCLQITLRILELKDPVILVPYQLPVVVFALVGREKLIEAGIRAELENTPRQISDGINAAIDRALGQLSPAPDITFPEIKAAERLRNAMAAGFALSDELRHMKSAREARIWH